MNAEEECELKKTKFPVGNLVPNLGSMQAIKGAVNPAPLDGLACDIIVPKIFAHKG